MIIGYGTSHDAGLAAVDEHTGSPLFAAGLERLTRQKSAPGSPLTMRQWLDRQTGSELSRDFLQPLSDDSIFAPERGWHNYETAHGIGHRWTGPEATLVVSPEDGFTELRISLVPFRITRQSIAADIVINGVTVRNISNAGEIWRIRAPQGTGPIREITLRAGRVLSNPPDPRDLGVLVHSVALARVAERSRPRAQAVSDAHTGIILGRLLRKHLIALPRRRLRGHSPKRFLRHVGYTVGTLVRGFRSASELAMSVDENLPISGRYDHHLCHAATAYYQSGFQRALVVSIDGKGDLLSCRIMRGVDGRLDSLGRFYYEELPVGLNYEIVTALLGFSPVRHAGKVTGLAAFGRTNPECEALLEHFLDSLWRAEWGARNSYDGFLESGEDGRSRLRALRESEFGRFSREDLAHAIQKRTEREVCELITKYRDQFPDLDEIALAGGVFANVRVNQKVRELGFRRIFVQPAMSDAGICMGAALLECVRIHGGALAPRRLEHVYLGPGFSNEEISVELERHGLSAEFVEEELIAEVIAAFIAEKRVVAHFNGRMEFGPRALGNRSILYSAADPDVNRWLNDQLERTEFMPFAPAVLAEAADDYFHNIEGAEHAAEFMTITFDCTERAKREIPAAVHVDGTARPQLVRREANLRFHAILSAYQALTGVPVVINTSFNMHEEPIVATPDDAIRSFLRGNLDVLVAGNYLVLKDARIAPSRV